LELRADFRRYYGLDLHMLHESYTLLMFSDLVVCLPHDSAVKTAQNPENSWGQTEILLQFIAAYTAAIAYGLADGKIPKPEIPLPPGSTKDEQRVDMTDYQMRLDEMRQAIYGGEK
jgi:hypothetical protein